MTENLKFRKSEWNRRRKKRSLFAANALNATAESAATVNTGVALSCIPRVRLQIGNFSCDSLLDSGNEIAVVNKRMLHVPMTKSSRELSASMIYRGMYQWLRM